MVGVATKSPKSSSSKLFFVGKGSIDKSVFEILSLSPSKSLRALYLSLEDTTGAGFSRTSSFLFALKLANVSSVTLNRENK